MARSLSRRDFLHLSGAGEVASYAARPVAAGTVIHAQDDRDVLTVTVPSIEVHEVIAIDL